MWSYEKIKKFFSEEEHKIVLRNISILALMFVVGFGSGKFHSQKYTHKTATPQANYSNTSEVKTEQAKTALPEAPTSIPQVASAQDNPQANCKIKGNLSSSKDKIYHIAGGAFFDRVKEELCFETEEEAVKAGFRKSMR